jgi:hypothetical protein
LHGRATTNVSEIRNGTLVLIEIKIGILGCLQFILLSSITIIVFAQIEELIKQATTKVIFHTRQQQVFF